MKNSPFYNQAELMLRMLPFTAQEKCFALKGGTAINFFFRDMPRLSVDIDLAYIPIESREQSLKNISDALKRVAVTARKAIPGLRFQQDNEYKLLVRFNDVQIKIEPNTVLRGTVFPIEDKKLCKPAQDMFELFVSLNTLSFADIYGGKLCAALDRQHPRDMFDIKLLLENEGITEQVRKAFVIYLASHDRPMHEVLSPSIQDFKRMYDLDFKGMTALDVSCEELSSIQKKLPAALLKILTEKERHFLISIKEGVPQWDLIGVEGVDKLPGIQWKLFNINRIPKRKHKELIEKLKSVLQL
jgi:predicted nucleotidyltransferase component of viral defense system